MAWLALPLLLAVALLAWALQVRAHRAELARRLLSTYPQDVYRDPELVRFADTQARELYARNCAGCHGADMRGNPAIGASDLIDGHWLWGNGSVFQIDRILLYGIRSGEPKGLHVTEMPAFGLMGRLSDGQVHELVQYIMKLNHRPYDAEAANAGDMLFHSDLYGCYDCHGSDARGEADYGAANLTANVWNNGGSEQDIYNSIYYGRHRVMPAWQGRLSLEQIRALAVYLHGLNQKSTLSSSGNPANPSSLARRRSEGG